MPNIRELFTLRQFIGVIGGQNDKSLYFIGMINSHVETDPHLIYLDPHLVQDTTVQADDTYYCREVKTVQLSKICASLAFGFLVTDLNF